MTLPFRDPSRRLFRDPSRRPLRAPSRVTTYTEVGVDNLAALELVVVKVRDDKGHRRCDLEKVLLDRHLRVLAVVRPLQLLELVRPVDRVREWLKEGRRPTLSASGPLLPHPSPRLPARPPTVVASRACAPRAALP